MYGRPRFKPRTAMAQCPGCGTTLTPRYEPDAGGLLRCSTVISESPYEECSFVLPQSLVPVPFVRIGASGVPNDGQSTWNVVFHQRMWSTVGLRGMVMVQMLCGGNRDADRCYEKLLHGIMLSPTDPSSCPITRSTYCNRRSSFLGSREFVLDLQDYAGETTRRMTIEDATRLRLLDCDGIVMFVDPTKPPEEYLATFRQFFADLKGRRAKNAGRAVSVPVALVVPKIDLLLCLGIDYGGRLTQVSQLLAELRHSRPINEGTTLHAIEVRSALVEKLLRDVVPLAHIRSMIEAVVGRDQVMVFPVATLGWQPEPLKHLASLGREAHGWLMENSFGVLDPVLWLLHRLGVRRLPA